MAVSKRLRFEVLRRDNHQCRYCGGTAPDVKLTVDHVIPTTLGGSDDPSNLVAACADCNSGKSAVSPDEALVSNVNERALQWAGAMEQVAAERKDDRTARAKEYKAFKRHWDGFKGDGYRARQHQSLPHAWELSIDQMLAAGLEIDDLKELAGVAMSHVTVTEKWKYFCGCCWRRVKQNVDRAVEILSPTATADHEPLPAIDFNNYDDWLVREYEGASQRIWCLYGLTIPACTCRDNQDGCGQRDCVAFAAGQMIGRAFGWENPDQRPPLVGTEVPDAVV